jgi:hypothetical protein
MIGWNIHTLIVRVAAHLNAQSHAFNLKRDRVVGQTKGPDTTRGSNS